LVLEKQGINPEFVDGEFFSSSQSASSHQDLEQSISQLIHPTSPTTIPNLRDVNLSWGSLGALIQYLDLPMRSEVIIIKIFFRSFFQSSLRSFPFNFFVWSLAPQLLLAIPTILGGTFVVGFISCGGYSSPPPSQPCSWQ